MIREKAIAAASIIVWVALVPAFAASLFAQSSLTAAIAATLFSIAALLIIALSHRRVHAMFIMGAALSILAGISQLFAPGDAPLAEYFSVESVIALLCGALYAATKRERGTFRRTD